MIRKFLFALSLFVSVNAVCASAQEKSADFQQKVMYVDFRTQVHTIDALKELARKTAADGFTSLLLEYEATFPFDKHATLCNRFAYTKEEIADYVAYCKGLGLDVIPLQNCMGHAQYILRHDRYAALREDPQDVSQVCPLCISKAVPVFTEIFSEVAALHPSKYFHIGCDETFLLGRCKKCAAYVQEHGKSKLFVEYVKAMCKIVLDMGKIPVIWADIILKYPENLGELPKELIYLDWNYGWDVNKFGKISNLLDAGVNLWGAPSLRCSPDDIYLTQWEKHFNNLRDYVPFARKSGYTGIVQTSWSTGGVYGYMWGPRWEILDMFPIREVYPESGFNILLAATAWAFNHSEPLDPKSFVYDYAKEKFGFDEAQCQILWDYFTMPQNQAQAKTGKDVKGRPLKDVLADAYAMKDRLATLKPSANKIEIEHFKLMLDIRINHLEFKMCESEFESKKYESSQRASLADRMTKICKDGKKLDKRIAKLNKDYLKPGQILWIQKYRGEKMGDFLNTLKCDATK
jgi:hypothetical protein